MPPNPARSQRWLVPVIIVTVAAILVGISLTTGGEPDGAAAGTPTTSAGAPPAESVEGDGSGSGDAPVEVITPESQPTLDMSRREADDPLAVGPVDAPVVLVVYSDFQCPFCAAWAHDTLPTMLESAQTGDLRIEFRDIAVFGEPSLRAARAAYAAALQGRYLDYHEALFADGEKRSPGELTDEALTDVAVEVGLDRAQFVTDLASSTVREEVQANVDEAMTIGVFSTPAFLLDGRPILGAQPTEVFVTALDEALARAR